MGALALLAALWPIVIGGLRDRRGLVPGAAVLAGVVALAALLAGAGARPSVAALDWKSWDLFGESGAGHAVALVWRSDYGGIDFPAGKTTVLRITAPRRALYWRATTLDTFASDRWVETLYATGTGSAEQTLPTDPLLPAAAARRSDWVEQKVDVRALVDDHVIGAGQPMALSGGKDARIRFLSGGVMTAPNGLDDIRHYTVWSYAPRPTPAALVRSPPAYPVALARYLDVGRTVVPRFGAPGRAAMVAAIFHDDLYQQLWPYEPMWTAGAAPDGEGRLTLRGDGDDRALAPLGRRLSLRRAPAVLRAGPAARRLPRADEARVLPAVRRDDGADAPLPRDPGACGCRVHERDLEGRHLDGHRPRRARLGGGVVRGLRLAHVRPDPGARHLLGRRTRTPRTRPTRSGRSAPAGSSGRLHGADCASPGRRRPSRSRAGPESRGSSSRRWPPSLPPCSRWLC